MHQFFRLHWNVSSWKNKKIVDHWYSKLYKEIENDAKEINDFNTIELNTKLSMLVYQMVNKKLDYYVQQSNIISKQKINERDILDKRVKIQNITYIPIKHHVSTNDQSLSIKTGPYHGVIIVPKT